MAYRTTRPNRRFGSSLLENVDEANLIDGDAPGLAAAIGRIARLTVFHEVLCQAGARHDQNDRYYCTKDVVPKPVPIAFVLVEVFSVLPHHGRSPLGEHSGECIGSLITAAFP